MPRPMKDSGVEWLGEIPAHWNCCKLKYLISSLNSGTSITTTDLTDEGYPVYGGGQQIGFFPQFNMEDTLIIGRVGSCGCVTKISGKAWATDNALIVTTDFPKDYLYYILVAAELNKLSTSNAQPLITSGKVLNHKVAVPPLDEQQRIATFLDGECARIDSVIEKTRASIVEYKKLKQAIITRAVTKGIRPARTMKDSGVEWLGEIPTDWDCTTIGRIATIVRGASPRPAGDPKFFNGSFIPWITVSEVTNGYGKYITSTTSYLTEDGANRSRIVESGTLLLSNSGATLGVPKITKIRGCINDGSVAFYKLKIEQDYLLYFLAGQTLELRKKMQGYGQPNLNTSIVKGLYVLLPPMEEQKEIAQYLDEKTAAIDLLVEKKNQLVTELERLKKSLIFEYVTGKKAVPQ